MSEARRRSGTAWSLRALVIASIALPLLVFGLGSYLAWRGTVHAATAELQRDLDVSVEQATRVFDTQVLIAAAVNNLVGDLDDATVMAREAELSSIIRSLTARFPQITTVTVASSEGNALLSSAYDPVDHSVTFSDREYFQALRKESLPFFVGSLVIGRFGHRQTFSLSRRRGDNPNLFNGLILVSVAPSYFEAFDRALFGDGSDYIAGVVRSDGAVLARYPALVQSYLTARPGDLLMEAIKRDPDSGIARGISLADGVERLIIYRRLANYPVFVTVGRSWSSVVAEWRALMTTHLVFGVPATVSLFALSVLAMRRTRRESATLMALQEEAQRRETAEHALRQAQKMEAVGRLTGGIAHDFNNHLMVVSSNIELLQRRLSQSNEQLTRFCDAALHGVRQAAALTQRLLAFSRPQPLDPRPLDVGRLVSDMSDLLSSTLGERVAVETRLADATWLTRADANQLENALLNLAVNARDAMPQGGTLAIETANTQLDDAYAASHVDVAVGQYVMLSISDTGTGMTQDVVDKAFEPFFTTKPIGQGTGLGLAMVYGFVKRSGGHVTIVSTPGHGSTVTMYLPRFAGEVPRQAPAAPHDTPETNRGQGAASRVTARRTARDG